MSVFRGSITEYPGVIVDHFSAFNCERGRAFFLSHCHKDHMTGLGSAALLSSLHRRNTKLYCTEVTRSLLIKNPEFFQLVPFLHGLPTDEPISMSLEAYTDCEAMTFTVTLLPAGHCPGSAMFFFQGSSGNVLYTGDFRLSFDEMKRLHSLHSGGRPVDIATLYLDTTFCSPIVTNLPSREVSRDHVLRLTERWLSENPRNVVHLQCAMFGFEHIYMGVAKKFNTKIHIASWRLNAYSEIPAVAKCLTTDGQSTRIHCCKFRKGAVRHRGLPCGSCVKDGQPPNVITIKPSTQWFLFTSKTITEPYVFLPKYNGYRVLHSMHASYSELSDFVAYLHPRRVVPCVVPFGDTTLTDVHGRLKILLSDSQVCSRVPEGAKPRTLPDRSLTNSETTGTSRKRVRNTASAAVGVDGASSSSSSSESDSDWSTGNDTIDEFPSSEEQTSQVSRNTFSTTTDALKKSPLPTGLALPSMLTQPSTSADHHQSSSPSESGTVGSLQQTPLDLSIDSSRTEQEGADITITGTNMHALKPEGSTGTDCTKSRGGLMSVTGLASPPAFEEECLTPPEQQQQQQRRSLEATSDCGDDSSDEEWCLTLENSTDMEGEEEKKQVDLPRKEEDCKTPVAKRRRMDQSRHTPAQDETNVSPKSALQDVMQTPRRLFPFDHHSRVTTLVEEERRFSDVRPNLSEAVIEYIDLTQDDDKLTTSKKEDRGEEQSDETKQATDLHHRMDRNIISPTCSSQQNRKLDFEHRNVPGCTSRPDHEVVLLSDSQSSRLTSSPQRCLTDSDSESDSECLVSNGTHSLGSPLFLPPTPGREGVESIMSRKNIAFYDF